MKTRELIQFLEKFHPDTRVMFLEHLGDGEHEVSDVSEHDFSIYPDTIILGS